MNQTTDAATTDESTAQDKRAVVLLSGGMDSATAAYEARARGYDICALHTSYGQRTETRELECARTLAETLEVDDFLRIETGHLAAIGGSSLTDDDLAVGDAEPDSDEIPNTYVPFRNANLLAMAVSYAEARDCGAVFIGAHSEDFAGYPDCRPAFFEAFEAVVDAGTKPGTDISIEAPFVEWSKTDIARRGLELEVPYEHTWSCYRDDEPACGTCDSCAFRLEAFRNNDARDPIAYAKRPSHAGPDGR
ncbi:7-cyano-7-deazaguanine synthase [Halostagnicola sp. A56]|uniref:7-cyano-7-deazaguanine synthase QueC n=1 Tax=Halostagnicola sp. A56 TaxID=1495067 RepID=UPI0004A058CA|nr:7-cyano-7-deazaguanine synthase QueC [Halostagnicola sp. A56]KDE59840.1 7-cyano-7-deazaguanine synthase [Halostagnicola sp. A56]